MINRTVPPLSIVPPGVTSWGTFSFVIALLVELQAVGDLINLALVPATLSFVSHPGLLNSFAMDGFLLVRLVDTPSKRLRVVSLQLVHRDRKSTRLNSSHVRISYAVFCLKKKKKTKYPSSLKKKKKTAKI